MLKVELHAHTSADPHDYIPHSTTDLIDRASELKYNALAITLHDSRFDPDGVNEYARERGITLIPGIEKTIQQKHVLLLNFDRDSEKVETFEQLAHLRRIQPSGLVIAAHPFYPARCCLGQMLERHADLFDAVELNAFYTSALNHFNRSAIRWALGAGKPIVANGDIHRLRQLGRTFTLVDAPPHADAICEAIRAGRVQVETRPLTSVEAAAYLASLAFGNVVAIRRRRSAHQVKSPQALLE